MSCHIFYKSLTVHTYEKMHGPRSCIEFPIVRLHHSIITYSDSLGSFILTVLRIFTQTLYSVNSMLFSIIIVEQLQQNRGLYALCKECVFRIHSQTVSLSHTA